MNIDKLVEDKKMTLKLSGRLDTTTSPDLDATINEQIDSIDELYLDFTGLEYISSAGLRVLLSAQKKMGKKGGMTLTGVQDTVMEVFEVTGFADILTIE
ncbi:MAG: STAS domain-containing protein [Firmicutes bacterium]|nr:STAS domain-containing protein [Bacillota bacterium]